MKNIWTVLKRELGAYFNSVIAYIYLIVFVVINNGLFMTRFFLLGKADMRSFFDSLPLILFIFIPVVSMRLWAEDKKENTFELLLTFPMKPAELVLGKFFASLIFYAIALLCTLTVPFVLKLAGRPDFGAIWGGYFGSFFVGALFLAIGIFVSGLTKEQIIAFVLTILSCFFLYFIGIDYFASFIDGWFSGLGTFLKMHLGVASHLISLSKGVMDIKDIVYFAVMCFVFLFLNGLFFEGRLRPRAKLVFASAVCVCLVAVLTFNWLTSDIAVGRFDMTEGKIYTVAPATKKILKSLKVPVNIKVYITPVEKMPTALKTLEQEITGKLDELRIVSDSKLRFEVFHIEAANLVDQNKNDKKEGSGDSPSLEQTLQTKGIVPFQVESIDRDELGVKLIYAAATIAYKEKSEEILPRLLPQNLPDLEYLLLSRIVKLALEKKPKIALFSPLKSSEVTPEMIRLIAQMGKSAPQYEDLYQTIVPLLRNNGYDIERVALTKDDPMPAELDTLLVINPGSLNDRQLYEINKFLCGGGSVLIAAQGFDNKYNVTPSSGIEVTPEKLSLDINKLIEKWGVKINDQILMDENSQIINVSTGQNVGPFALSMPVKVPNQIMVQEDTINKNMPLMSRLPSLFYLWGSALDTLDEIIKGAGLKKTVMFTSSQRSWKVAYAAGSLKSENTVFPRGGSEGKLPLGVMLQGQFNDTFAKSPVPDWPKKEADPAQAAPSVAKPLDQPVDSKPGKLIVLGCSQMFADRLIRNPGNLSLFANIVDGLTLGDDIIQIRSKTPVSRDIKRLTDRQKMIYRFLTVFLVPLVVVAYASLRLFLRRKEKQFYLLARG